MKDEKNLLERSKKGDIDAFEQLIECYQKKVFNIALRLVGDYHDAGEIAQEVFIRVFKSIGQFREESSFSTWIYKITTNTCMDELRKRKNKTAISIDDYIRNDDGEMKRQIEDNTPTPDIIAERNELISIIKDALQYLSDEHRVVIVMRDMQGYSYEEISKQINCPEGTVKSRINRARQALREVLKTNRELFNGYHVK